jgi:hypothetical protein
VPADCLAELLLVNQPLETFQFFSLTDKEYGWGDTQAVLFDE